MEKRIMMLGIAFSAISFGLQAMEDPYHPVEPMVLEDVDDVPAACVNLIAQLVAQPLFNGYGSIAKEAKVLPLQSWDDCRIIDILSKNARLMLPERGCEIYDFGNGNDLLYDRSHMLLDTGITWWFYENYEMCSLPELQEAYKKVVEKLKMGWGSILKRCPADVMFKKPLDDWYLFIKKEQLEAEDVLVRFLVRKFHLEESVSCMDVWLKASGDYEYRGMVYLWVKKDAFDEFNRIFKFYYQLP